ncbi:MAG: FtsX-like permease family protein [Cyclobacteriaceae bacterium]|nr:FtsX-like permease family protein [Cyclobacteriaceae bacterium]
MAIGAKKIDIAYQFLLEAVMISVSGGLLGVILGTIHRYKCFSIG